MSTHWFGFHRLKCLVNLGIAMEKLHALSQSMRLDAERSKLELPQTTTSASLEETAIYEEDDENERGLRQEELLHKSMFHQWIPTPFHSLLGPSTTMVHFKYLRKSAESHATKDTEIVQDISHDTFAYDECKLAPVPGDIPHDSSQESCHSEDAKISSTAPETKVSWMNAWFGKTSKATKRMEDKYPQYAIAKRVIHQNQQLFWMSVFGLFANVIVFIGRYLIYCFTGNAILGKPLSLLQILGAGIYFCLFAHRLVAYLIGFIARRVLRNNFWEDSGIFNIHIGWISYRGLVDRQQIVLSNVIWLNPPGYENTPYLLHIKEVRCHGRKLNACLKNGMHR